MVDYVVSYHALLCPNFADGVISSVIEALAGERRLLQSYTAAAIYPGGVCLETRCILKSVRGSVQSILRQHNIATCAPTLLACCTHDQPALTRTCLTNVQPVMHVLDAACFNVPHAQHYVEHLSCADGHAGSPSMLFCCLKSDWRPPVGHAYFRTTASWTCSATGCSAPN